MLAAQAHWVEQLGWRAALAVSGALGAAMFAVMFYQFRGPGLLGVGILYAVGVLLLFRKRVGVVLLTLLNLPVLGALGVQLIDRGVMPRAYDPRTDFMVVVVAVPAAMIGIVAAVEALAGRHDGERSHVPAAAAACLVVWTVVAIGLAAM